MAGSQEEVAQIIATMIAQEQGIITKILSLESRNKPPSEMETYEAIHKFYKFETTFSPETFLDALEALEHAAIKEPECPQVWTYLGGLYCENYGLEIVDMETPIEKGVEFAEKGVQLYPLSQRARVWTTEARLLNNQLPEGLVEAKKAYMETLNFRLPFLFWDPLLRAITLGHLERIKEGNRNVKEVLKLKADFPARGRFLIERFIKSDELIECMIEGLKKAGLDLD